MKQFYVYILCDRPYGYLYTGVTSNLVQRIHQHKSKVMPGHTQQKNIGQLVYFEIHETAETAILAEKKIKKWKRQWKFNLIEHNNPHWNDLYAQLT
jgi:putative endonuclease